MTTPGIVTHIAFALHSTSSKVRSIAAELLAALCVLSLTADGAGGGLGHKLVIAAFSDYRIAFEETFRFEELIGSLKLPEDQDQSGYVSDGSEAMDTDGEEGLWEARTSVMALVNALTNCPESLEDRIMLREEFGRRGLNEAIVVCAFDWSFGAALDHTFLDPPLHQPSGEAADSDRRLHRREI